MGDVYTKFRSQSGEWRFRDTRGDDETPVATGLTSVPVLQCRLRLSRPLRASETPHLRGFFGKQFADQVMLHHHKEDGALLYEYPRVQFKVLNQMGVLLGLGDGSGLVARLWSEVETANLGGEDLNVLEATMVWRPSSIGETEEPVSYRFLSSWLALNQDNTSRYHAAGSTDDRTRLLERILIGNCLSFSKAFGHTVRGKLVAECSGLHVVETTLKGTEMIGFRGSVRVNFQFPDLVGIGKSVSRGFGTLRQITPDEDKGGNKR